MYDNLMYMVFEKCNLKTQVNIKKCCRRYYEIFFVSIPEVSVENFVKELIEKYRYHNIDKKTINHVFKNLSAPKPLITMKDLNNIFGENFVKKIKVIFIEVEVAYCCECIWHHITLYIDNGKFKPFFDNRDPEDNFEDLIESIEPIDRSMNINYIDTSLLQFLTKCSWYESDDRISKSIYNFENLIYPYIHDRILLLHECHNEYLFENFRTLFDDEVNKNIYILCSTLQFTTDT